MTAPQSIMPEPRVAPPVAVAQPSIALTFGPAERKLFGVYHAPTSGSGASRACGVVLCNPLGYEAMCTHRVYRHFAEELAKAGFHVLRFDYDGTGDSSGNQDDPDRVRAWLDSIGAALDELRQRTGGGAVSLFGLRLGATLAAAAAAERGDVGSLVLWAPSPSGRAYVREMRAFSKLKGDAETPTSAAVAFGRGLSEGDEEAAGYLISRATIAELTKIDLLALKNAPAGHSLLLQRDDIPGGEERLTKHLATIGVQATCKSPPGYSAMMRDAHFSVVPDAAITEIISWLGDVHPAGAPRSGRELEPRAPALATTPRESPVFVREEAVRFAENDRLFGVLAEPRDAAVDPSRPVMVFLNVGSNHHVGPNRMYVVLARELAARGFRSLRFDVGGIGDSRTLQDGQENRLYSKDSVNDVRAAMTYLRAQVGAQKFVLVGLCSGAYLAFHTALEDQRVSGQILINPQTFAWTAGDSLEISMRKSFKSTRFYVDALSDPEVWKRALRGKVNVKGIAGILRERLATRAKRGLSDVVAKFRGREGETDIARAFRTLSDRGLHSLLIFSANDGGLDMLESHLGGGARKMKTRSNFHMEIVEGADHTFTPVWSQQWLYETIAGHVAARFA